MNEALNDKALIFKSYPKKIQSKLQYLVGDILEEPRNLNTIGNPEQLKHTKKEMWSRNLSQKDRIVYAIEQGSNYNMPEEKEIIVFYQYLGHYLDK
ncbi:MAG: type II toxin-antitoxin system YoeB family toxin [Tannerella sp.]|nr:type II toxin-antitoxin system YoeB family toxin [Tannerella sp.]